MQNIFMGIFLLIIGSFIAVFMMTYRRNQKSMHKVCTESTLGKIEDFEISHHQGQKLYTEICTYEIDKKVYTKKSSMSAKEKMCEIGDEILICYEPGNPQNAFIAHDIKINPTHDIILWAVFAICIISGIIMF